MTLLLSSACESKDKSEANNTSTAGSGGAGQSGTCGATVPDGAAGTSSDSDGSAGADAAEDSGAGDAAVAGSGGSAGPDAAHDSGVVDADTNPDTGPFPPVADFAAAGPYTSTTIEGVGPDPGYTVYLRAELAPNGAKNPIVGWMSGGDTTHTNYSLLPRLATHGFVVVAADVTPAAGDEINLGQQLIAGIEWMIEQNSNSSSEFEGKLNVDRIASMGYSMGSLATFTIADDPRLTTTVHISGGNFETERVHNLRAPAIFICGAPGDCETNILDLTCDAAAANCDADFAAATTPVFYANFNAGHLGVLMAPTNAQIRELATKWLRWKLMDDRSLDSQFLGSQCGVCRKTTWLSVQQKNLQ